MGLRAGSQGLGGVVVAEPAREPVPLPTANPGTHDAVVDLTPSLQFADNALPPREIQGYSGKPCPPLLPSAHAPS